MPIGAPALSPLCGREEICTRPSPRKSESAFGPYSSGCITCPSETERRNAFLHLPKLRQDNQIVWHSTVRGLQVRHMRVLQGQERAASIADGRGRTESFRSCSSVEVAQTSNTKRLRELHRFQRES